MRAKIGLLLGASLDVGVLGLLFANAYGCLVPENVIPYACGLFALFCIGTIVGCTAFAALVDS